MTLKTKTVISILCVLSVCSVTNGQVENSFDLEKLLNEKKLTIINRDVTPDTDASKKGIALSEDVEEGLAWINGVQFSTGTIEIDLKGQDVYQHSFLGIAFHGVNDSTFDAIYFRPFQFRTDDPARKARGIQYISLPAYTWQKLRSDYAAVYEQPVEPAPDPDNWFHVKIEVKEKEVLVYVNNQKTPTLRAKLLNERKTGMVALYTADRSGGSFANLFIQND